MMAEQDTDLRVQQKAVRSHLIVFGLALGPWPMQYEVLSPLSSARDIVTLTEWSEIQSDTWFLPLTWCQCCTSVPRSPLWMEGFSAQVVVYFSPLRIRRVLSSTTCIAADAHMSSQRLWQHAQGLGLIGYQRQGCEGAQAHIPNTETVSTW